MLNSLVSNSLTYFSTRKSWRPYRKDIDKVERIQRRATKIIPEFFYKSRLLECGLTTLETRRLRGDQIEVFKIVNGYKDIERDNVLQT